MKVITDLSQLRALRKTLLGSVGLVPTMGALHAGHAALIEASVADNDHTVMTIFVNPTQFNDAGDLNAYPRSLDDDLELARALGVDVVLAPDYQQLYPDDFPAAIVENLKLEYFPVESGLPRGSWRAPLRRPPRRPRRSRDRRRGRWPLRCRARAVAPRWGSP